MLYFVDFNQNFKRKTKKTPLLVEMSFYTFYLTLFSLYINKKRGFYHKNKFFPVFL
jgi:hypothetical protein